MTKCSLPILGLKTNPHLVNLFDLVHNFEYFGEAPARSQTHICAGGGVWGGGEWGGAPTFPLPIPSPQFPVLLPENGELYFGFQYN